MYNDKPTTIERFKGVYKELSEGVKARLVLENDEMCFSVDDLLPICEELNIPLVLGQSQCLFYSSGSHADP